MAIISTETDQLRGVERLLAEKYSGLVTAEAVTRSVTDVTAALSDVRIRTYLPVLVRREAEDRLRALLRNSAPPG